MSTFNISGCCTLRDTFAFRKDNRHDVIHYLQFSSPVTWFEYESVPERYFNVEDLDGLNVDFEWKSNFTKRCVITDYNRSAKEYYKEKADFFILDLIEMVKYGLIKQTFPDERESHFFTASGSIAYKNKDNQNFLGLLSGTMEKISPFDYLTDEMIEKIVSAFYDWLIFDKGYTEDQIILVKTFNATEYYDHNQLMQFSNKKLLENENELVAKTYECFANQFSRSHIINLPGNLYGVVPHKWGIHPLHFCAELYDYLYECFDLISTGNYSHDVATYYLKLYEIILGKGREICDYSVEQKRFRQLLKGSEQLFKPGETLFRMKLEANLAELGWKVLQDENGEGYRDKNHAIEAFRLSFVPDKNVGIVFYQVRVYKREEWTNIYCNENMVGTVGYGWPLTGIRIWLDEKMGENFSVIYEADADGEIITAKDGERIEITDSKRFVGLKVWIEKKNKCR